MLQFPTSMFFQKTEEGAGPGTLLAPRCSSSEPHVVAPAGLSILTLSGFSTLVVGCPAWFSYLLSSWCLTFKQSSPCPPVLFTPIIKHTDLPFSSVSRFLSDLVSQLSLTSDPIFDTLTFCIRKTPVHIISAHFSVHAVPLGMYAPKHSAPLLLLCALLPDIVSFSPWLSPQPWQNLGKTLPGSYPTLPPAPSQASLPGPTL